MEASVSEIHRHPLRPPGFAEPLFLGREDKKEILEHLSGSSRWLGKASEAGSPAGALCHVYRGADGSAWLARAGCRRRRRPSKRRVARVLERWREVRGWWEPGGGTDRLCFRVLLSGGAAADLALDRGEAGGWSLLRVLD